MAETTKDSEVKHPSQSIPFLEVLCKSSGKIRRFSAGTESGFAVNLINEKLISSVGRRCLLANHIEAVKEGEEEPVSFGPTSLLVDYGSGWNLQTVIETNGDREQLRIGRERVPKVYAEVIDDSNPSEEGKSPVSYLYFAKILLAFLLIFVFGAIFTLFLENLPRLILYINSFE